MEGAKSWLSPFSSLKRSLVLQSLGAAALALHGADTVTPWVEIVWFVLEQPWTGGKPGERRAGRSAWLGARSPSSCSAAASSNTLGRCHLSSRQTNWASPWSPIPTNGIPTNSNGLVSEMQKWQISLENGHLGSDDFIPVFVSHHGLLFVLDK